MIQTRIIVSGKVQSVGFRFFVKSIADDLKIKGWVRNLPNGSVEALLQGEEKDVLEIIKHCKKGPRFAEVTEIDEYNEETNKIFQEFSIK